MSGELIDMGVLSAVPGLTIVARSSSFQVKVPQAAESREEANAAGVALNARYLVEGTIRIFTDDRARIAAAWLRRTHHRE